VVLLSFLAAAAAFFALGEALGLGWTRVAALAVAFLGALAKVVIVLSRERIKKEDETAQLDRRTLVRAAPISTVDPTRVGVDSAAQTILPGETVPEYVPRDVDGELRDAIRSALDRRGPQIVVAVGSSKVGKSRAVFEALRHADVTDLDFVAPVDGAALMSLLTPGEMLTTSDAGSILWLDDLEPFINEGVTLQTLREWHEKTDGKTVIAATYGGKGSEKVQRAASGALATIAGEILQQAREIAVQATSPSELSPLRAELSPDALRLVELHGLAAYLVAAPQLQRKLNSHRHAIGEPECPEGVAVVMATVDWARCGRTDPLPEATLRDELWQDYLPGGMRSTDAGFEAGVEWALRHVAGSIALLEDVSGFRAYDYVVRLLADDSKTPPPKDSVWASAVRGVKDSQAFAVGVNAYLNRRLEEAVTVFEVAMGSDAAVTASTAGFNLGVVLRERGDLEGAIAAYDVVCRRFDAGPDSSLAEQTGRAMVNKGVALGELERFDDALAVYDDVVDCFGSSTDPLLEEQVAKALFNKGVRLSLLERFDDAVATYDDVIRRYADAEQLEIREQLAHAMTNKGVTLGELGRFAEAITTYDEIIAIFADAEEPALVEQVARALFNKGVRLGRFGRPDEEMAAYDEVVARFDGYDEPRLREQVAKALLNKGAVLGSLDRTDQELAVYGDVVARFDTDREPRLREQVAKALFNRGVALGNIDQAELAIAAYEEVLDRFGDAPELELRRQVAMAAVNLGVRYAFQDESERAIEVYDDVVRRFGDAEEAVLLEQVGMAMVNRAVRFGDLDRPQLAIDSCDELLDRLADVDEAALLVQVAKAQIYKALMLGDLDRPEEELELYDDLVSRFGEEESPLREQAALALLSKGFALSRLDRSEEAVAAYDEVIGRFGRFEERGVRDVVAKAIEEKEAETTSSP
jgi:tetratricopeptide (TPR) repeat protein